MTLISSGAAYHPGSAYADAKLHSERLVQQYGGIVLRLFTFMGPHFDFNGPFAAGNFIRDALLTGVIRIKGDGTAVRSYMHTDDMAKWVWHFVHTGVPAQIYDIGSDKPVNMISLAEEIARQAGQKTGRIIEVEVDCGNPHSFAPKKYLPERGLECAIGLKDAISLTLDWAIESLL